MNVIENARVVFWDFDGVIKESVDIKTNAFTDLFRPYGDAIASRIREHHLRNSGVSRQEKIPLYLRWAGVSTTDSTIDEFCERFSQMVLQAVIDAPWVDGVERWLRVNPQQQTFILVSATPYDELLHILHALDLSACFAAVYGAPTSKADAIRMTMESSGFPSEKCLMIGDAHADMEAAMANDIPFLLRRHDTNADLFSTYAGESIRDFSTIWIE